MHKIDVAGHLCLDITPTLPPDAEVAPGRLTEVGALTVLAGGSIANTGGALSALGAEPTAFGSVGADVFGTVLLDEVRKRGISARSIGTVEGGSTSYSIVVERPGLDRGFWHHTGTNSTFDGETCAAATAPIFHLGYPSLLPLLAADGGAALQALLSRARNSGNVTSVDLAVVDPVSAAGTLDWESIFSNVAPEIDVISPSFDDLTSALHIDRPFSTQLADELCDMLIDMGVAVVALSAGRNGLFIQSATSSRLRSSGASLASVSEQWSSQKMHIESKPVGQVRTTNGAGDAGSAGLIFGLAAGASLRQAGHLATTCSSVVISGRPPTPANVTSVEPTLASVFNQLGSLS